MALAARGVEVGVGVAAGERAVGDGGVAGGAGKRGILGILQGAEAGGAVGGEEAIVESGGDWGYGGDEVLGHERVVSRSHLHRRLFGVEETGCISLSSRPFPR